MLINVTNNTLTVYDVKDILDSESVDNNLKVFFLKDGEFKNLVYCLHDDLVTFIPDYDKDIETLSVGNLLKVFENHELNDLMIINFAEISIMEGIKSMVVDKEKEYVAFEI